MLQEGKVSADCIGHEGRSDFRRYSYWKGFLAHAVVALLPDGVAAHSAQLTAHSSQLTAHSSSCASSGLRHSDAIASFCLDVPTSVAVVGLRRKDINALLIERHALQRSSVCHSPVDGVPRRHQNQNQSGRHQ